MKKKVTHTCPRRKERPGPVEENKDSYTSRHGLVGQRSGCSFCGSMDPVDFMAAVLAHKEIGPTDKGYKLYLGESEGKFYTEHFSEEQGDEFVARWRAHEINWGYPGGPYVPLYIPGQPKAKQ